MGIGVDVGAGVAVGAGVGGIGVAVGTGVCVGIGVGVGVGDSVAVGASVGSIVGTWVGVGIGARVGVGVSGSDWRMLGMGVGIRVGTGADVNVGGIVLSGCSAAGAGLAWVGDASSGVGGVVGVAVTTTVTTGGPSLPQADSVIARLINAVNVRLILSIVCLLYSYNGGAPAGSGKLSSPRKAQ